MSAVQTTLVKMGRAGKTLVVNALSTSREEERPGYSLVVTALQAVLLCKAPLILA